MKAIAAVLAFGTLSQAALSADLQGYAHDEKGVPVAEVQVRLELKIGGHTGDSRMTKTDSSGHYNFTSVPEGSYVLRATATVPASATFGPFHLETQEHRNVDLVLKPTTAAIEYSDEPAFTVAGVTENAYVGGHGSDTALRSKEALTNSTASLSHDPSDKTKLSPQTEQALRAAALRDPGSASVNEQLGQVLLAEGKPREALSYLKKASQLKPGDDSLHFLIAAADETLGYPLEAVREYQRAAEMNPSESNLFAWGTELLIHQAPIPAGQIFDKGAHLFPTSARMLIAAAVASYSAGDYRKAARLFFESTDLEPSDPDPYLFLGKVQSAEITGTEDYFARMQRFARLRPDNAWANYYYAVTLMKRNDEPLTPSLLMQIEGLLEKAVNLDGTMAGAYLQLGILRTRQNDPPGAIEAYKKAIAIDARSEQAHYRLAQAYRLSGNEQSAQSEMNTFGRLSSDSAQQRQHERSELQRFVVNLKSPTLDSSRK